MAASMLPEAPESVHICFFTDSLEPSGVGVHLLHLMRWLDPARFQMSLVCPDTPDGQRLMVRAARLGVDIYPLAVRDRADQGSIDRLYDLLRQESVTIFHSQVGISWEGMLGLRTAYRAGVPVRIVTEHLPYLLTHPGQVAEHRETCQLADRIITVSEGSRRTFLARGYPAEQFVCIHNGTEPLPKRPREEAKRVRQALGVPTGAPLLLTVARLTSQKGHDVLLAAAPTVLSRYPKAYFACVGEGPELTTLQAQARALGVEGAVHFLGHRDDIPALLGAADLFILPSRFEGHPLAALEALAAGLPVVGTRVCGLEEVVVSGETGLLVEPDQPTKLAEAILELLPQREIRKRMGQAGKQLITERYNARRMARETMDLYERLLQEKGLQRPAARVSVS